MAAPRTRSEANLLAAARSGKSSSRPAKRSSRSNQGGSWWESLRAFLGTVLVFLVIRAFLVEAFRIPSGSMIPTLLVGDWLFVNKLVYGPHVPFTSVNLPGYADPRRGDVVVFVSPYQADEAARGNDATPTLVKRLWGTPGDTLYMREGLLYINGIPQPQGYLAAQNPKGDPNEVSELFAWQRQYALTGSRFGAAPLQPTHDSWGPLVVPPKHYFMLGDNRYNSKDSRYWGVVPRENLRGRPLFVYYSYNADDSDRALPFLTDIRWGRIGHTIK
ncbi:signal peptidase I [Gemmatirosa kalamazoonensis]|uniref:Signal peptidase I n=1 Tax=Gemmatirosa kalamazoonensis TaxID=861299 RepID=W0RGP5_9BACT|nr:signal peptidase I [Gemmatirosa kalamazoonensis]AHG89602.1 signal peptidase I [Gemmatirosa kalamazoonensis]